MVSSSSIYVLLLSFTLLMPLYGIGHGLRTVVFSMRGVDDDYYIDTVFFKRRGCSTSGEISQLSLISIKGVSLPDASSAANHPGL
jgi:hypothetical protein